MSDEQEQDSTPIHVRYRPAEFDDVIGQNEVVKALRNVLKSKRPPHSYLFVGPSGCGKTTLARIVAKEVGCCPAGIIELDAAKFSSVDDTRRIVDAMQYRAIADTPQKAAIVDEAHRLSAAAWGSLLKSTEEPAKHAYWLLATTDAHKVPVTMKTRCHTVSLQSVKLPVITKYLEAIAEVEEFSIEADIIQLCSRESGGSVRQALVYLAAVSGCADIKEAKRVIASADETGDLGKFMRQLCDGSLRWTDATFHLSKLQDEDPEGTRLAIVNYVQKAVLSAKQPPQRLLAVLDAFSRPCNRSDKVAPLLTAIGKIVK